jgi:hypothetical protein
MRIPFTKAKRIQRCLLATEDGRVISTSMPVELGYMVDEKALEAWLLHPDTVVRKRGTNDYYAIVDERDAAPQLLGVKAKDARDKFKASINDIAQNARRQACYRAHRDLMKDKWADLLRFMVTAGGCLVAITILAALFTSGRLSMPF